MIFFSFQEYPVYFMTLNMHDTHLLNASNIPDIVTRGKKILTAFQTVSEYYTACLSPFPLKQ